MRYLVWTLRVLLFFTLFAFALNNEHVVTLNWFFGYQWRTPLVIVVLVALAAGAALGVLAMVPSWWRHRSVARRQAPASQPVHAATSEGGAAASSEFAPEHPPREGL